MIYLDYNETTPMSLEAIDSYVKASKEYIGSISANNDLGKKSRVILDDATKEISNLFNVLDREIIYTSGATEANNMALIGVALANHKRGKHIIVSKLEHSSVYEICSYLESIGFEISYVDNDEDGLIKFDHLKSLIRDDTILVSVCAVNNDIGIRQPLKMLRQIIKKENEHVVFHSDLSAAIGKTSINFRDIDLGSVSAHKFYGPKGIGFLYKNDLIKIAPILHGNKNSVYKPGLPALPLIVSMATSLKTSLKELEKRERYVTLLNERLIEKLSNIEGILINNTKYSIPYVLNISTEKYKAIDMINTLSQKEVYISGNKQNELCSAVMAIYNDLERSKNTIRISLSHLTTVLEINNFITTFELEHKNLNM